MNTRDEVCAIITRDNLTIVGEEKVYTAAMLWLNHGTNRTAEVATVFEHTRLPFIQQDYLLDTVSVESLTRSNLTCSGKVIEALRSQLQTGVKKSSHELSQIKPRPSTVSKLLLVAGGDGECYNVKEESWSSKASAPTCRHGGFGLCVLGGEVYAVGGAARRVDSEHEQR